MPECMDCRRDLTGHTGWAEDWKVLKPEGWRMETRYICDDCEAKR